MKTKGPFNQLGRWKWVMLGWIAGMLLMMALAPALAYGNIHIVSEAPTSVTAGEPYTYVCTTDNPEFDPGYTWTVESGPAWLHFNGNVLSGTPPTDGEFDIVIQVDAGGSGIDTQEFTLGVEPGADYTWIFFILILFMISAVAAYSRTEGFNPRVFMGCFSINIVMGVWLGMLEMWMVLASILMTAVLVFVALRGGE